MSYVSYSPVPTETVLPVSEQVGPSEAVLRTIRISRRMVAVYCFLQLALAAFALFASAGGILYFIITAIFVSLGLTGVFKQRYCFLMAHFVYSMIIFILSVIIIIPLFFYCDHCSFVAYIVAALVVCLQVVGLRHCRMLMCAVNPGGCFGGRCRSVASSPPQQQQQQSQQIELTTIQPTAVPTPATMPAASAPYPPMFPNAGMYPAVGQYGNMQGYMSYVPYTVPYAPMGQQQLSQMQMQQQMQMNAQMQQMAMQQMIHQQSQPRHV